MKRKNYIFSLALALLMGTMTMSLTACSSEDNIVNSAQQPAQGEVHTYTVSIPATIGGDEAQTRAVAFDNSGSTPAITTKFVEDEKVYVYNNTTPALLGGYLVVKNVSADMKSCELQGQLTGTINPDDEVVLYYNLNVINSPSDLSDVHYIYYNYNGQDGTAASCVDGAKATMKVKAIDASNNYKMTFYAVGDATKTQAKAEFDNLQSMFRFQFADATAPTTPIKVKTLNIQSKNTALANRYYPLITTDPYYPVTGGIDITPETATADYLYVGLCIRELSAPDDVLYFWVTDDEGNEYRGSKSAPTGGFANGKYYYNSVPIALTKQPAKAAPVITWTNPSEAVTPSEYTYTFETAYPGSADITIANASGKDYCSGYAFDIKYNATIRLNAVNAIWNYQDSPFIKVSELQDDATLVLTGDNTISCNGNDYAIDCTTLKLSCTGTSATLTLKIKTPQGMYGGTNYYSAPYDSENDFVVSNLAANGYTVERTGGTSPDADGVYTTTYTVAVATLSAATTADHGKVVCAAGHLHDAKTAVPTGCTAVGILGKVTETGHGLILALENATSQTGYTISGWTTTTTDYAGTTLKLLPDDAARGSLTGYTTLGSTTVSNWAVAQKSDYEAIFQNLGSTTGDKDGKTYDGNVNAYITTGVGGTEIPDGWSATEDGGDRAWRFFSDMWRSHGKSFRCSVRPVLGF